MRRKNYMVAGDELTTVSGQGGLGDITGQLAGEVQQASAQAREAFNQGIRSTWRLGKAGFEERQPEQPAAQATQADEDELVQRAGNGGIIRSRELDDLGPEAASRVMNRAIRMDASPNRQTIVGTDSRYKQANQAIRGMLGRRNASRIETRGSFPGDVRRGAIETTRDYEKRKRAFRKQYEGE